VGEDAVMTGVPTRRSLVEELYLEQGDTLWRAILAFSGDRAVADDAVSEAFAQLLRRGDAVRNPTAWVWTACFRIAAGELRKRSRASGTTPADRGYEMPDPLPEVIAALATLPTVQRTVVVMHDYADRPASEIAHTLGITRSTVRVHLSTARRKLRALLEESR
jgi:RNA polymerase sigma-70 factor (ECF subfamily)